MRTSVLNRYWPGTPMFIGIRIIDTIRYLCSNYENVGLVRDLLQGIVSPVITNLRYVCMYIHSEVAQHLSTEVES